MSFWKRIFGKNQSSLSSLQSDPIVPFECWLDDDISIRRVIQRPILYMLQHKLLPDLLSQDEVDWAYYLKSGTSTNGIIELASIAAKVCESSGLLPRGATDLQSFPIYIQNLMSQVSVSSVADEYWDIRIISMPKPIAMCEAYWVALCFSHERTFASGKYYTLESSVEGKVAFCEWTQAGGHMNYGIEPLMTYERFVSTVLSFVSMGNQNP